MGFDITLIIISLMGWFGSSMHEPICSVDDRRYSEAFGIDKDCEFINNVQEIKNV